MVTGYETGRYQGGIRETERAGIYEAETFNREDRRHMP